MITLQEIQDGMPQLPSFPSVVRVILETLRDEDSHLETLTSHLQQDPVLSARVLSLANRPGVGHDAGGVRDVFTAASMVGLQRIRKVVLSANLIEFSRSARCSPHFWEHSLAVAVCMQELSPSVGLDQDYALVAGLLHDIGDLWLRSLHPQDSESVMRWQSRHGGRRTDVERRYFGLSHSQVGAAMLRLWQLPEDIVEAVAQHHEPEPGRCTPLAAIACVSEALCNGLDLPVRSRNEVDTIPAEVSRVLGRQWLADLPQVLGRVEARYRFEHALLSPSA